MTTTARAVRAVCDAARLLAAAAMLGMLALTVADVFLRYVFARPVAASGEITQFLLGIIVFAGLILVSRDREHVVVSLLENCWSRVAPGMSRVAYAFFAVAGTGAAATVILLRAASQIEDGELSLVMEIREGYVTLALGILAALACAVAAAGIVQDNVRNENSKTPSGSEDEKGGMKKAGGSGTE